MKSNLKEVTHNENCRKGVGITSGKTMTHQVENKLIESLKKNKLILVKYNIGWNKELSRFCFVIGTKAGQGRRVNENNQFKLTMNGHGYSIFHHRLVYKLFIGNIPEGMTVDHIKVRKIDYYDHPSNLRLLSLYENQRLGSRFNNYNKEHTKKEFIAVSPEWKVVYCKGITDFAEEHGMNDACVSAWGIGRRKSYHGWRFHNNMKEYADWKNRKPKCITISQEGKLIKVYTSILSFANEYGLKTQHINRCIKRQGTSTKGWKLFRTMKDHEKWINRKPNFVAVTPKGEVMEVYEKIVPFSIKYGLNESSIHACFREDYSHHKEWKFLKIMKEYEEWKELSKKPKFIAVTSKGGGNEDL